MRKKDLNSDNSLMEGFRAGQHYCFTEIFNLLYAPLCYYATRITHDQSAAEDLVEDSFIKIWDRRVMFFEKNVLKSYLYTTVKNASINWIKKQSKTTSLSEKFIAEELFDEPDTFKLIVGSEIYNQLSRALENLSPKGKEIIRLIFFEGKKTRIVAEELGISQSTVKTQKERALISLQKQLARK